MPESTAARVVLVVLLALVLAALPRVWSLIREALGLRRETKARRTAREPDMSTAPAYHQAVSAAGAPGLDDRTWRDLDLDDVFCRLDFTDSEPGRQYLYRLLRAPHDDVNQLMRLDRAARALDHSDERTRVRRALAKLQDPRAARLVSLFYEDLPARPAAWPLFPVLTVASLTCLALAPFRPGALLALVGVCVVNVAVQVRYRVRVRQFAAALHQIPPFLRASATLGHVPIVEIETERDILAKGAQTLASLSLTARWLQFQPALDNELISTLLEYFNLLFLVDLNAYVFSVGTLRASQPKLRQMYAALGYVDAAQSLAAWRATVPEWSVPFFAPPGKHLQVDNIIHPLVANPVPNSLRLDGASALISGSNMAGKTTFVRALGVNAVLAQTLATVCGTGWRAPLLHVRSSIGRTDSVTEGKSYYLAEVESVLGLIHAKTLATQHLFLLDETFRGTNTTERVAAAYAVLRYLNEGQDFVAVATHDLEVLDMLGSDYAAFHFREQIHDDQLTFDYCIQPGPSSTRNAIALLRFMKYPERLVDDATAHLNWQAAGRSMARADSVPTPPPAASTSPPQYPDSAK